MIKLDYETKRQTEKFGLLEISLETVADLDQTIDRLCESVGEHEAESVFAENLCPYFGVVWPAARALTNHLAQMDGWLNGKSVLEVGCGLALPSIAAAKLGARVTATDFHPDVPRFLERNLQLNSVSIDFKSMDWTSENSGLGKYDFVIGSDILYESSHPKNVARALVSHCHDESHIILTDPGRVYLQTCVDEIKSLGFRHDMFVHQVRDLHHDRAGDKPTKEVFVVVFQKL
ncbi:MAG: methyltransferase domain-containing protein [Bdellovibrionota bacterium]